MIKSIFAALLLFGSVAHAQVEVQVEYYMGSFSASQARIGYPKYDLTAEEAKVARQKFNLKENEAAVLIGFKYDINSGVEIGYHWVKVVKADAKGEFNSTEVNGAYASLGQADMQAIADAYQTKLDKGTQAKIAAREKQEQANAKNNPQTTAQQTQSQPQMQPLATAPKANKKSGSKLEMVIVGASWCGVCLKLYSIMDELMKDPNYSSTVKVIKADYDNGSERQKYNATSVPTVLFFKDGKEVHRAGGSYGAQTSQVIDRLLRQYP